MVRSRWLGALAGTLLCLAPVAGQVMKPAGLVNVREGDGPARQCKVLKLVKKEKDGGRVWEVQALDNGEKMQVLEPAGGPPAAGGAGTSVVTQTNPEVRGLLVSWFGTGTKPATQSATAPPPLARPDHPAVAAGATPAKSGSWRESWGKADQRTEAPQKPGHETIPLASKEAAEPLTNPEQYSRVPLPTAVTPVSAPSAAAVPAVAQASRVETKSDTSPLPPPRTAPTQPGGWWSLFTLTSASRPAPAACEGSCGPAVAKEAVVAAPAAPAASVPMMPRRFLGSGPIAGSTERVVPTPQAARAVTQRNVLPLPYSSTDYGGAAGNAFSSMPTYRPIPSDMGMSPLTPGAFEYRPELAMQPRAMPPMPPQPLPPAMRQQMMMAAMAQQQAYMMQMAMAAQYQAAMAQQTAMAQQAASQTPKLLADLREAVLPSEREMAVERLRYVNWKAEPEALQGLTDAAKSDPSPAVRAACVRVLGQMKANTVPVIQTLEHLCGDRDPKLRDGAREALQAIKK